MTLTTGGNLGIGTTSPYAKLSVVGQTVAEYFSATSTTATSTFSGGLTAGQSLQATSLTSCEGGNVPKVNASGFFYCATDATGGGGGAGFIVNATGTPAQLAVFSGLNALISTTSINVASLDATSTTATSSIQRLSIGSIFQIASDWIKGLFGRGLGRAKDGTLAVTAPTATYVPQVAPVWTDQLDSGWADWYANGTVAHDATVFREGEGSIKYIMAGGGVFVGMRRDIPDQNWNDRTFHISVRSTNWTDITALTVLVSTEGTFTSFFDCDIRGNLVSPANDEWIDVTLGRSDCSVGAGTPQWDGVNQLIIRATATTGGGSVWVDGLTVHPAGPRGVVSIVFDDGYDDTITEGRDYMDKYGYKGTAYVIPDGVGGVGYMTQDQVESLHENGWEVSMHGATNLTTLSLADLQAELDRISAYRVQYGFDDGFAYPNGATNDQVISEIKKRYTYARNISFGHQSTNYYSPYQVNAVSPSNVTATSTLFTFIDRALANNEHLIITFHNLVTTASIDTEYRISGFREVIDYLNQKNATVVPVKQAMQLNHDIGPNKKFTVGTSTSPTHRLFVDGTINGNLPIINCPVIWPSDTAISADMDGSATVPVFPCNNSYYFEVTTDGVVLGPTQALEAAWMASGTPLMNRIIANNAAGAGAGGNLALLKSQVIGAATSTRDGLTAEHWVSAPNVGTATTSVTYLFGFSDVSITTGAVTTAASAAIPKEGCLIVASSTANWRAVCRRNNVETANVDILATSTAPFEITYQLNQEGFRVWINDDQTPRATIGPSSIPTSFLRHIIGVGDATNQGSATAQGTLGIGALKVWSPFH